MGVQQEVYALIRHIRAAQEMQWVRKERGRKREDANRSCITSINCRVLENNASTLEASIVASLAGLVVMLTLKNDCHVDVEE